jgi:hypothetical protein
MTTPGTATAALAAPGAHHGNRTRVKWLMTLAAVIGLRQAAGAFVECAYVDQTSLDALGSGRDICGDGAHANACLRVIPCADVDPALECTEADPVWRPDPTALAAGGKTLAFHAVLPAHDCAHKNDAHTSRGSISPCAHTRRRARARARARTHARFGGRRNTGVPYIPSTPSPTGPRRGSGLRCAQADPPGM